MAENRISRRGFLKLAAVTAGGAVLVACAPAAPAAPAAQEAAAPAPAAAKVTIRFNGRLGEQGDHFQHYAEVFMKDHPEIEVKVETFPGADYFKKVNTMIAGGTIGDGMWISSIEGFYRMAATGTFAALDPLVEEMQYDLTQFYPLAVELARYKGNLYGLPWVTHPGRVGLFYSKTMFENAGVDLPNDQWTYDDLLAAAKKLTQADGGTFGFLPGTDYFSLVIYQRAWGGDMLNKEGTKALIDSAESVAALQYIADLFHKDKVSPLPTQVEAGTNQMVAANKLAMFQSGFWGNQLGQYVPEGTWGATTMPTGPAGVKGSMYEFDPVCVTAISKHPKETFMYLTYLCTKEAGIDLYKVRKTAPGARPDVWRSEEVLNDPTFKPFGDIMDKIMPLYLPANFRETEYAKNVTEMLTPVWLGEKKLSDVIADVQKEAQAILDKPSLEKVE